MKITEKNFLKELTKQNPKAIEYIVQEYGPLLKAVLIRQLYDQKDHWEECFNDVLLALWNNSGQMEEKRENFKGWICAIAKYKAIDLMRRELRIKGRTVPLEGHDVALEQQEDAAAEELEKLLGCLSQADRELFIRRYVDEEPMEQIVKETGLGRDLIYARISRGKKKLRKHLGEGGKCND